MEQCQTEEETRHENQENIGNQRRQLLTEVDRYEERNIAKIKELANISRAEIISKHDEYHTALDNDVAALQVVKTTTATFIEKLEKAGDETLLFVQAKRSKVVARDGETQLRSMATDWIEKIIKFYIDKSLETAIDGMKSLGLLEDDNAHEATEYEATFLTEVRVKRDAKKCTYIYDMCVLDSSELLVVDYTYNKLTRFSSELAYKDYLLLTGYPIAVCKIDANNVAVRTWYTMAIHFVSVGATMHVTYSITLPCNGYGMTYDAATRELFVCENTKVSVYSKSGNKLRSYERDTNGFQIFSGCRQIALSENKQYIYVTDKGGLVVLNNPGSLKAKLAVAGVGPAWPLCVLPGRISLVGGETSSVICQVDGDGKHLGHLITDGKSYTYSAVYDSVRSRLIVGSYPGVISVYKLSIK